MRASQRIQLKKTISWSVISFVITTIVGWLLTGDFAMGLGIGLIDRICKMGLYYAHERAWHKKYKEELKRRD